MDFIFNLAGHSVSDKMPVTLISTLVARACVPLIIMTTMSVTVQMIQLAKHVRSQLFVTISPVSMTVNVNLKVLYLSVIVNLVSMAICASIKVYVTRIIIHVEVELVICQC